MADARIGTGREIDFAAMLETLREFKKQLDATILAGWPEMFGIPSMRETAMIISNYNELCLVDVGADDAWRWIFAGQLVARYRRNIKD